jgi:hypothetical protein
MAEEKPKHPGGRPTKFNQKLAERICHLVSTHPWGLKRLCSTYEDLPDHSTINSWRLLHKEFSASYAQAKMIQADLLAEDTLDIADDISNDTLYRTDKDGDEYEVANNEWINRSRLRVDTRKWLAAKLLPTLYGEAKRVQDLEGQNSALREEMRELREQLAAKHEKEY